MRWLIALGVMVALSSLAHADDAAHTRAVVGRHAARLQQNRMIGGVGLIAVGAGIGFGGAYIVANVREGGGLVDFSDIERGFGYGLIVVGGLSIVGGGVAMVLTTDVERMHDELVAGRDAAATRAEIARKAAAGRRTRRTLFAVGGIMLAAGAVTVTSALVAGDAIERDTRWALLGSGFVLGALAPGFMIGSRVQTQWETIDADLREPRVQLSVGLVPTRGGALLGIGGTF